MWFKPSSTELHKLVTLKPSLSLDVGYGLFAERKFQVGDIVSVYIGKVLTEHTDSNYKLEWGIPKSKEKIQLDVEDGGFPDNKLMYLGAHMVNDPQLTVHEDDKDPNRFNVKISHDLALVVRKEVNIEDTFYTN